MIKIGKVFAILIIGMFVTVLLATPVSAHATDWSHGGDAIGTATAMGSTDNYDVYFITNNNERMRIKNDGKVGIGTASPSNTLSVDGNADIYEHLLVGNSGTAAGVLVVYGPVADSIDASVYFQDAVTGSTTSDGLEVGVDEATTDGFVMHHESKNLSFGTSGTDRMRILSGGNVGIGMISPNEILTVEGAISLDEISAPSATAGYGKIFVNSTDSLLYFKDDSGNEYDLTGSPYWSRNSGSGYLYPKTLSDDVGIGLNTPTEKLHIHDDRSILRMTNSNTGTTSTDGLQIGVSVGGSTAYINQREDDNLTFIMNTTNRMIIDKDGRVAIASSITSDTTLEVVSSKDNEYTARFYATSVNQNKDIVNIKSLDLSETYNLLKIDYGSNNVFTVKGGIQEVGVATTTPVTTLDVNGGFATNLVNVTASPYNVLITDYTILVNTTSTAKNINLPDADDFEGRILVIKKAYGGFSVNIIPDSGSSDRIDGSTNNLVISTYRGSYTLQSDGTDWYIISAY